MKAMLNVSVSTEDNRNPWQVAKAIAEFLAKEHPEVKNIITVHDLPEALDALLKQDEAAKAAAPGRYPCAKCGRKDCRGGNCPPAHLPLANDD